MLFFGAAHKCSAWVLLLRPFFLLFLSSSVFLQYSQHPYDTIFGVFLWHLARSLLILLYCAMIVQ